MAQPAPYERAFGFAAYQEGHPMTPLPGDKVDTELDAVSSVMDAVLARMAMLQRDDLKLQNGLVGYDQLAPELRSGFVTPVPWLSGVMYLVGKTVYIGARVYVCVAAHVATDFATDETAGKWAMIADFQAITDADQQAGLSAAAAAESAEAAANAAAAAHSDLEAVDADAQAAGEAAAFARLWATEADGVAVAPDEFSSRHWAHVAQDAALSITAITKDFATKAAAEAATISSTAQHLRIAGYSAAGDGGAALYRRVGSAPGHAGKLQSADGDWWELAEKIVTPKMFGAAIDGTTDDTAAVQSAFGWGKCFLTAGTYLVSALTVQNPGSVITAERGARLLKKAGTTGDVISIIDVNGVRLSKVEIDGNASNVTDITANGVYAKGFSDLIIDDITSNNNKNAGILTVANTDSANLSRSVIINSKTFFNSGPGIQYNTCSLLDILDNAQGYNAGIAVGDFVNHQISVSGNGTAQVIQTPFHAKTAAYLQVVKISNATGLYTVLTNGADYTLTNLDNPQGATVMMVATVSSSFKIAVRLNPPPPADINHRTILSMEALQSHAVRIARNRILNNQGASIYLQNRPDWTRGQTFPNPLYGSEQSPAAPFTYDFEIMDNIVSGGSIGLIGRGMRGTISNNHVQGVSNSGFVPQGSHLTMVGNKAIGCGSVGFDLGICTGVTFTGNTAMDCWEYGVELTGCIDMVVAGNRVVNNCQKPGMNGAGIAVGNGKFFSNAAVSTRILIIGNHVGGGGNQSYGILVQAATDGYTLNDVQVVGNSAIGSGSVQDISTTVGGNVIVSGNHVGDGTFSTLGGPTVRIGGFGNAADHGMEVFSGNGQANRLRVESAPTGGSVLLKAVGSDPNIDFEVQAKGSGTFKLPGYAPCADAPIVGSFYVKDAAGNLRRVACIS